MNVSARQFLYGDFLATLAYCLEDTGCKAAWLELEITESLLLEDDARISMTLETIARLGILISIDDFGTGYSALGYLHKFPIGGLKIDQSFIRQVDENEKHEVLIDAILKMARGLNLKTVAEGIETEKNANLLARLGCDQGQGYFWHKPMPAEDMLKLLPGNVSRDVPQRRSA
ncbi:MAG: EAL domain-containing protein [Tepidamorphaceae bacterium]